MNAAPFVACVSPGKLTALLVLGLVMVAAALVAALLPDVDVVSHVLAWVGVAFFSLCVLAIVRQLFRTGPVLEIGPEGLLWRRWSAERIPWAAFVRAAETSMQRQRFVSLWLRDPECHRSTTAMGRLAGANKAIGFGDITLAATGLSCSHAEILAAVRANAPQLFA